MINIVLYDNDPASSASIRSLVEQELPAEVSSTIFEARGLGQLRQLIARGTHIHILIADVMMDPGEPSGIEVVASLFPPTSGTQVIYASGHLEQALEVYRTAHHYFLLKPVDPQKLREALEKALAALPKASPAMLHIKDGHKERLINTSTIRYIESNLHKAFVHCGPATYQTYAKLDDLQAQLPAASFSRCHRSFVVNLAFVGVLEDTSLKLHDGTVLPVSRRRKRQLQHDLLAHISASS